MGRLIVKTRDYDGESSVVRFPSADLATGNIVAKVAAGDALVTALEAITACVVTSKEYVAKTSPMSGLVKSTDPEAHRESKWLVRYHDDTTFTRATCEVPGPIADQQSATARKTADLADEDIAAFVSAFEAFVIGPGGNAAVVDEMIWVGRPI